MRPSTIGAAAQRMLVAALGWSVARVVLPAVAREARRGRGSVAECADSMLRRVAGLTVREAREALRGDGPLPPLVRVVVMVPRADAEEFRELLDEWVTRCRAEDGTTTTGSALLAAMRETSP